MSSARSRGELVEVDVEERVDLHPVGADVISRTQNRPAWSSVLNSEFETYILLPSPVTCIMLGWTPGRDGAEELGMVGVGDVPLLEQVVAEAAHEQVAVVGALPQVGRQGPGVGDLLEFVGPRRLPRNIQSELSRAQLVNP